MNRQEANRKIIEELSKAVEKYPDLRFHQILFNSKTLERMAKDY